MKPIARVSLALLILAACRTAATTEPAHNATKPYDAKQPGPASATTGTTIAAPTTAIAIEEPPLAWGTRPARTGRLFPVVDGICVHGEMWPLTDGTTLFSYGNPHSGYSRGGFATLAIFSDTGLDRSEDSFKAKDKKDGDAMSGFAPFAMVGSWSPGPLLVYSNDMGGSRSQNSVTIWARTPEGGWSILGSHREENGPGYEKPVLFKGNAILVKTPMMDSPTSSGLTVTPAPIFRAVRVAKDAAALANIGALGRSGFDYPKLFASDEEIYAIGGGLLRVWRDGKVRDVKWPASETTGGGGTKIIANKQTLFMVGDKSLYRLDGDTFTSLPITGVPSASKIINAAITPNGDAWLLLSPRTMVLKREAASGKVIELPIPMPGGDVTPAAKADSLAHWPASGSEIVGVEHGDPYAIAEGGQIAHFENGKWELVEMPKPPFAAAGRYRAQLLGMATKGDLYVNAGYGEKGPGWKTWERYRAILRTKRPAETLRCNEPEGGASWAAGMGFMSFPPLADDTCKTPFAVIVRTAYNIHGTPMVMHDKKSDWASVRESVKATPSLAGSAAAATTTIDLVEFESGSQRYVGAKVPSVQAGKDFIEAAAKRVKVVGDIGLRPELVCGTDPTKIVRTIKVEIATGKILN